MKFDLDVIQNDTLDVKLGGAVYNIKHLDADTYISVTAFKDKLTDDGGENVKTLRQWIGALAPEIPAEKVNELSLRSLYALLQKLDTFQGGVVGDDVGNVPKAGGSQ